MKKYKITFTEFNPKTKMTNFTETLTTKPRTEDQLEELIRHELLTHKNACWSVSPYPKDFHKRFETEILK